MGAAPAVSPEQAARVLPEWVPRLLAEGGDENPWITVGQAQPYLPMTRNNAYRACQRYLARVGKERQRRRSFLIPAEKLFALPGELPCEQEGRSIWISKRLLLVKLLGYLPVIPGRQP